MSSESLYNDNTLSAVISVFSYLNYKHIYCSYMCLLIVYSYLSINDGLGLGSGLAKFIPNPTFTNYECTIKVKDGPTNQVAQSCNCVRNDLLVCITKRAMLHK